MRPFLVVACAALVSGCAIRYDHGGVSRVGIGLWGFGDPPGVNWNLDWPTRRDTLELQPHRETPELPPRREPSELPPRREPSELPPRSPREICHLPHSLPGSVDDTLRAPQRDIGAGRDDVIDDDRCPAAAGESFAHRISPPARADPRRGSAARS